MNWTIHQQVKWPSIYIPFTNYFSVILFSCKFNTFKSNTMDSIKKKKKKKTWWLLIFSLRSEALLLFSILSPACLLLCKPTYEIEIRILLFQTQKGRRKCENIQRVHAAPPFLTNERLISYTCDRLCMTRTNYTGLYIMHWQADEWKVKRKGKYVLQYLVLLCLVVLLF